MSTIPQKLGYSADVKMQLFVNGHILSVGQLGLGFLILDDSPEYPPIEAVLSLSIDGKEKRWTVYLPDGITAAIRRTRMT